MRAMRLPHPANAAIDVLIVLLALTAVAELWLARRPDATVVTTVLALGATATLLARRAAPAAAMVAAPAAQAALLEAMPQPMITIAVALAASAMVAGAARAWWPALGGIAVIVVAADYAFHVRRSGDAVAFAVVVAGLAVCWAAGLLLVRTKLVRTKLVRTKLVRTKPAPGTNASDDERPSVAPGGDRAPASSGHDSGHELGHDSDLADRRLAIARGLADTVDAGLSALIVEAVAVQQALVRDAHPEDVLVRMRAVEENARTASADLRRLLAVAALDLGVSADLGASAVR
jgi:hypothetical protein